MKLCHSNIGIVCITACFVFLSCEQGSNPRHYSETLIEYQQNTDRATLIVDRLPPDHPPISGESEMLTDDPKMQRMLQGSVSDIPIQWKVPVEWSESKGSGMRIVTFHSQEEDAVTCTIISLGGMAGGLEANVDRWAGQLGVNLDDDKKQQLFRESQTVELDNGQLIRLINYALLQKNELGLIPSMMAAIIQSEQSSIFIKMTGTKAAVVRNQRPFESLIRSITY